MNIEHEFTVFCILLDEVSLLFLGVIQNWTNQEQINKFILLSFVEINSWFLENGNFPLMILDSEFSHLNGRGIQ